MTGTANIAGDLSSPRFFRIANAGSPSMFSISVYLPWQSVGSDVNSGGVPQYMLCVAPNVDRQQMATFPAVPTLYPDSDVLFCGLVSASSVTSFTIEYDSIEPLTFGCYAYCRFTLAGGGQGSSMMLASIMDDFMTISMKPEGSVVYVEGSSNFRMSDCIVVGRSSGIKFVDSTASVFDSSIALNAGSTSYIVKDNSTVTESNVSKSARS